MYILTHKIINFNNFFKKNVKILTKNAKKTLFFHNYVYMNKIDFIQNCKKIHFIGIGGVSMSALAKFCLNLKVQVSGSDKVMSEELLKLQTMGVRIYLGHHRQSVIGKDLVVYSSAISSCCPELVSAVEKNIPIMSRGEFLGKILIGYKNCIAVSGSHGKTTATAMLSEILIENGSNPTVFLGGQHKTYGNFRRGRKKYAIVEACEYKKNFLNITHSASVVLNIDDDHMDSYEDMQDMKNCFRRFIRDGLALINADDENSNQIFNKTTSTFGIKKLATFNAKNLRCGVNGYSFDFYAYQKRLGRINLSVLGRHNVYNALAAGGMAYLYKISFSAIKRGLEKFSGVNRRNEYLGKIFSARCYADYAHHPKEIQATLSAYKATDEKSLIIFQPHTFSRTRILIDDFVKTLGEVKNLIIYKTYSARESFDEKGSAKHLYEELVNNGVSASYSEEPDDLAEKIEDKVKTGIRRIIVLGAGDIYDISKQIILSFKTNKNFL